MFCLLATAVSPALPFGKQLASLASGHDGLVHGVAKCSWTFLESLPGDDFLHGVNVLGVSTHGYLLYSVDDFSILLLTSLCQPQGQ